MHKKLVAAVLGVALLISGVIVALPEEAEAPARNAAASPEPSHDRPTPDAGEGATTTTTESAPQGSASSAEAIEATPAAATVPSPSPSPSPASPPTPRNEQQESEHWYGCKANPDAPECSSLREEWRTLRFNDLNGVVRETFGDRFSNFTLNLASDAAGDPVDRTFTLALVDPTKADETLLRDLSPNDQVRLIAADTSESRRTNRISEAHAAKAQGAAWTTPIVDLLSLLDEDAVEVTVAAATAAQRGEIMRAFAPIAVRFVDWDGSVPGNYKGAEDGSQAPGWGGQWIHAADSGSDALSCSLGFQARYNSNNHPAYVTAKHCVDWTTDFYLGPGRLGLSDNDKSYIGDGSTQIPRNGATPVDAVLLEDKHAFGDFTDFDRCIHHRDRNQVDPGCRPVRGSTSVDHLGDVVWFAGGHSAPNGKMRGLARKGIIRRLGHQMSDELVPDNPETGDIKENEEKHKLTLIEVEFAVDEFPQASGVPCQGDSGGTLYELSADAPHVAVLGTLHGGSVPKPEYREIGYLYCSKFATFEDIHDIKQALGVHPDGEEWHDDRPIDQIPGYKDEEVGNAVGMLKIPYAAVSAPTGSFETASYDGSGLNVHLTGSATDHDHSSQPVTIDLITSELQHLAYATASPGFDAIIAIPPSAIGKTICAWARDIDQLMDSPIGCLLPTSVPFGSFESVTVKGLNQFDVKGWAVQPGSGVSRIRVTVDGATKGTFDTSGARSDVQAQFGVGATSGFTGLIAMAPGPHNVCATAINLLDSGGTDKALGCINVLNDDAVGQLDTVTRVSPTSYEVRGWAADPNQFTAINVHDYVDAQGFVTTANKPRPDLGTAWSDPSISYLNAYYGVNHGIEHTLTNVPPGPHRICSYGINASGATRPNGSNGTLGCRDVGTVAMSSPFGGFDTVSEVTWKNGPVHTITGWAIDPDTTAGARIDAYWNPGPNQIRVPFGPAVGFRSELGTLYPGWGANHGFSLDVPVPPTPGPHQLCVYAIDVAAPGANTTLGCKTVATPGHQPFGRFDSVASQVRWQGTGPVIDAVGWTVDPDTTAAVNVHIYVDGVSAGSFVADQLRGDVDDIHVGYGDFHGFKAAIPLPADGTHSVCAYGINTGTGSANTTLGCVSVTTSHNPIGKLDAISGLQWSGGRAIYHVKGWALDPDTTSSIPVHVYVDGMAVTGTANLVRDDIATTYDGYGNLHGYDVTISLPVGDGPRSVCAYGINQHGGTGNALLECKTITVSHAPVGALLTASGTLVGDGPGVKVTGWALDPDTNAAIQVDVYVDGVAAGRFTANTAHSLGLNYWGYGGGHGYSISVAVAAGSHTVCTYGINQGQGSGNTTLGCQTLTVGGAPIGALDSVVKDTTAGSGIKATGWAIDPDTSAWISVDLYLDGVAVGRFTANIARDDVALAHPAWGSAHGYSVIIPASAGTHQLCAYGINQAAGANALLGCRSVVV